MALLSGLQAIPSGEGFLFRHEASGFTFQLAPAPCSPGSLADPSCQAELAYVPLQLGSASQVRSPLPCVAYGVPDCSVSPQTGLHLAQVELRL